MMKIIKEMRELVLCECPRCHFKSVLVTGRIGKERLRLGYRTCDCLMEEKMNLENKLSRGVTMEHFFLTVWAVAEEELNHHQESQPCKSP